MSVTTTTTPALALDTYEQDNCIAAASLLDVEARRNAVLDLALQAKRQFVAAARQRDEIAAELDTLRSQNTAQLAAHLRFREEVRDVAIRVQEEQGWCTSGLNEVLDELGLERKAVEYEVVVTVTAQQTVTVTVTAEDEDAAKEAVINGDVSLEDELRSGGWEWQTMDDLEFDEVSPV